MRVSNPPILIGSQICRHQHLYPICTHAALRRSIKCRDSLASVASTLCALSCPRESNPTSSGLQPRSATRTVRESNVRLPTKPAKE